MNDSTASNFEVGEPILNIPYAEPGEHWLLKFGEQPRRMQGRRPAGYWYRSQDAGEADEHVTGVWTELTLVNLIRERMREWRAAGRPGITRTTRELIDWWLRDGRWQRLFFAQFEAAETIIFLAEARADFLQGIAVPRDEPSDDRKADGFKAFRRQGCKMATGSGKDDRHGHAGRVVDRQQGRQPERRALFRRRRHRLSERDDPQSPERTRSVARGGEPLSLARPRAGEADDRSRQGASPYSQLARLRAASRHNWRGLGQSFEGRRRGAHARNY